MGVILEKDSSAETRGARHAEARAMARRAIAALLAFCLVALALSACGGGGSSKSTSTDSSTAAIAAAFGEHPGSHYGEDTVAKVGALTISRPFLNLWMTIELGEDYYSLFKREAPDGLVADPPNLPACVAALQRLGATPAKGKVHLSTPQRRSKCEQLTQAIKAQALTFLVASDWLINFDAAHGVNATDAELGHAMKELETIRYPKPGQFEASLRVRRRDLGEEMYLAKIDILQRNLQQRIEKEGNGSKLSKEASSAANTAICRPGYVVTHCKEFRSPAYTGPAPGALLKEAVG
jgi:hypothetical protein